MKKRRKLISGATRHDMSVGCVEHVSGHEFVYLSVGKQTQGQRTQPWQSRCPMVTKEDEDNSHGKQDAIHAWGVTVTSHQAKHSGISAMSTPTNGLSLAPVCVVAVSGPVTVFWNWREGVNTNEEELPKMETCRNHVNSRGLVLHDVRPGIGMDVVLYDSWDRADQIKAI